MPPVLKVGNLSTKRDISDVRDVVRAYISLIRKGKAGEAYNICSQEAYSIRNVLKVLLSMSKKKIKVEVDEAKNRPAEIPILEGDNSRIRKTTGCKPRIPLKRSKIPNLRKYSSIVVWNVEDETKTSSPISLRFLTVSTVSSKSC